MFERRLCNLTIALEVLFRQIAIEHNSDEFGNILFFEMVENRIELVLLFGEFHSFNQTIYNISGRN